MNLLKKLTKLFMISALGAEMAGCAGITPSIINENYTDINSCAKVYAKGFDPGIFPGKFFVAGKSSLDHMCVNAGHIAGYLTSQNKFSQSVGMNAYSQVPANDQTFVRQKLLEKGIKFEELKKSIPYLLRIEQKGECVNSYYAVPGQKTPAVDFNCGS